jgi:hypothetical protein
MKHLRIILAAAACLMAAGANADETPDDFREYKIYCDVARDPEATDQLKAKYRTKDLSYAQCAREVRSYKRWLKTLDATSNISEWRTGCTVYCAGVYPRAKFMRGLE